MTLLQVLEKVKKKEVIKRKGWLTTSYISDFNSKDLSDVNKRFHDICNKNLSLDDFLADDYYIIKEKEQDNILHIIYEKRAYLCEKGFSYSNRNLGNWNFEDIMCKTYRLGEGCAVRIIFNSDCSNYTYSIIDHKSVPGLSDSNIMELNKINEWVTKLKESLDNISI